MIPFKKYSDIASKLSKKLKISKEKALQALVKIIQKENFQVLQVKCQRN